MRTPIMARNARTPRSCCAAFFSRYTLPLFASLEFSYKNKIVDWCSIRRRITTEIISSARSKLIIIYLLLLDEIPHIGTTVEPESVWMPRPVLMDDSRCKSRVMIDLNIRFCKIWLEWKTMARLETKISMIRSRISLAVHSIIILLLLYAIILGITYIQI